MKVSMILGILGVLLLQTWTLVLTKLHLGKIIL